MRTALTLFLSLLWLTCAHPLYPQEERPRDLFAKAYTLFSHGNLLEAEGLLVKALDTGSPLEDYSLYFLGVISSSRAASSSARNYFSRLKQGFPQSVWLPHASLQLAKISLTGKDYSQALEDLKSLRNRKVKGEVAEEALYLLAQTYEFKEELPQAYSVYQELRRSAPLSPWAAAARKEVGRLRRQYPQLFSLTTPEALAEEGELLLREREYPEAERVYRRLLDLVPRGSLRPRFLTGLANVYRGVRRREEEIPVLSEIVRQYPASPEAPNALYQMALNYWNRDENLKALEHLRQLKERYPGSPLIDSATLTSARIYESLGRPAEAMHIYQDFPQRFPQSPLREEASWRLAWMRYFQGDHHHAYDAFRRIAVDKGADRYKNAALYWQGRTAEKIGRPEEARQLYLRIVSSQEDTYYLAPAARALVKMGVAIEERRAPSPEPPPEPPRSMDQGSSFHLARAQELAQISLHHLALAELDEIKNLSSGDPVLMLVLAREYARIQAYNRSVVLANQLNQPSDQLDRYRYPLAYWEMVRKKAEERGLDPYLILALMRQESTFDPKALSPASAHGLMQLLPSTAARAATRIGLRPPRRERLFDPDINLTLGAYHLKALLRRYSNSLVKAVAAYNAGENAVDRWLRQIPAEDEEEFIERIPYGETRLYVKLVLRNYLNYKRIYDQP